MLKITVSQKKCVSCGLCVSLAPKTFRLARGKMELVNPTGDEESLIKEAAGSCPVGAIKLVD